MKTNFSVLFYLKKPKNYLKGAAPIYLRITVAGKRAELTTIRECDAARWNTKVGRMNGTKEDAKTLNSYLENMKVEVYASHTLLCLRDEEITAESVKCKFLGKAEKSHTLLEAISNQNMKALVGKDCAAGTLRRFEVLERHVIAFLASKYQKSDLNIKQVNYEFISRFDFFLRDALSNTTNTAIKHLKNLGKIVFICLSNKWITSDLHFYCSVSLSFPVLSKNLNDAMRKTYLFYLGLLLAFSISLTACKKNREPGREPGLKKAEVAKIEEVLNSNDQNLVSLLNKVRGSVGKRGPGSKTIWSRKNEYGLGLYISANHVYSLSGWTSRNARFFDLSSENAGIFESSQIPAINGNIVLGNTLIADFPLMHFNISSGATNTTILPAEDFYLGIVDNQRIEQGPFPQHPNSVQTTIPLQMYDPDNRTKAGQTWNTPVAGEKAIAIGYPQNKTGYPNGAVAYGKILSDAEATDMIQKLKTAGDTEGDTPYNQSAEFFVAAQAIAGMSGGGVFNSDGQLIGIMVRASDKENAPKIIRVVKISYIKSKMTEFYNSLPETSKQKIRPFISAEL